MKIQVSVNGETHEVDQSDVTLPDGVDFISEDNVPKGYFTQNAVNSIVKENVNKTKKNLKDDEDYQRKVLSKYGIVLGEDGKPQGLEPDVDIDEVKKQTAQSISQEYEEKLEGLQQQIEARNNAVVESAIMEAVSGNYEVGWTKSFDGEKPLAVEKFKSRIGVDEEGKPYVKEPDGSKMIKGDGVVRPKDYLLDENRFGSLLKDKRQGSSGLNNGSRSSGLKTISRDDLKNMSDEEYAQNREKILNGEIDVN